MSVTAQQRRLRWAAGAAGLRLALLLAFGRFGFAAPSPPPPADQALREYDVKAALLFNFTRFVEWPDRAFAHPDSPVVIGILGQDPFGRVLDDLVRDEKCAGRPIAIVRFPNLSAVHDCHILFIGASERGNLARIVAALRGRPILTVGDFDGFTPAGGMIRLLKNPAAKIQLRINLNALKAADLAVSAKLLRVAEAVNPPGD
jgi:YfiR/HmsC-like